MKRFFLIVITLLIAISLGDIASTFAAVNIPGSDTIASNSIAVATDGGGDPVLGAKAFGFRILAMIKLIVSGIALIYLVLIGVYLIVFPSSEDNLKKQRKQIIYAIIGFLFLNIPSLVYEAFQPGQMTGSLDNISSWSDTSGGFFWNSLGLNGILGNITAFLRVFVYGIAVFTITYGMFRLLMSGGNDERQKIAKKRITYGILALFFMGFVEWWARLVAVGDLTGKITSVFGQAYGIGLFFAAPVAIFFLMLGGYYYITSAGEEERTKKGKAIIVNTLIATVILLAGVSFMREISTFTF